MKNTNLDNQIRHGECLLYPVNQLPEGATPIVENAAEYIVAHSETGHHHVAVGKVSAFQFGDTRFIRVSGKTKLEHRKSFDKHKTVDVAPGVYQIRLKKEYDPTTKLRREVRD